VDPWCLAVEGTAVQHSVQLKRSLSVVLALYLDAGQTHEAEASQPASSDLGAAMLL
jgi:hypothetical protein